MPSLYQIHPACRYAHVVFTGSVTGADMLAVSDRLTDDPAWLPAYDAIWDLGSVHELLLSEHELKAMVAVNFEAPAMAGPGRDVIVASRDLDRMLGELFLHLVRAAPRPHVMVRTRAEACAYLGVGEDAGAPQP